MLTILHETNDSASAVNRDAITRTRGKVFAVLAPLLLLTGAAVFERFTEGRPYPWRLYLGFAAFWLTWASVAIYWWSTSVHARTVFAEEGIVFARLFGESVFIPWKELRRVKRTRLFCMWVFSTTDNRVWLHMAPFRIWIVDGIILEHVPPDCEMVGRFRNCESFWDF